MSSNRSRPEGPTSPAHSTRLGHEADAPPVLNGTFLAGYDGRPRRRPRRVLQATPAPDDPTPARRRPRPRPRPRPQVPLTPILQSCQAHVPDATDLELILGESNLLPFAFLREGDRVGRAVVKIARGDGAAGTGFLVAPGILLTNHHVLPDPQTAADARALANFEADPPRDPAGRPVSATLRPDELFVTNPELDFTFCAVDGLAHLGVIRPGRTSFDMMRRDLVNIIQHPRGRPKEVALQDNQVVKVDPVVLHYACDTEPGSSGSPVLDNRWRLVALHHASVVAEESRGGRRSPGGDPRLRYLNEGIRLSAIALWLETDEADAPPLRAQTARLRALFDGLDPQAGFFGALGRRPAGRNAAQLVVDCYRRGPAARSLDLGAWDLSDAGRPVRDRLDDLGRVVAEMGLDLWCLVGLSLDDARRLADHLDSHHRLDYRVAALQPQPGHPDRPPIAILHRQTHAPHVLAPSIPDLTAQLQPIPELPFVLHLRAPEPPSALLLLPHENPKAPEPQNRSPWTTFAAHARAPRGGASLLIALNQPLTPDDLAALRRDGHNPRLAASGPEGGFALLSGRQLKLDRVFVTANLVPLPGSHPALLTTDDRRFPPLAAQLSPRSPLALRLVFPAPRKPRTPAPNEPKPRRRTNPNSPPGRSGRQA